TRFSRDWSSDVCSSDLDLVGIDVVQHADGHEEELDVGGDLLLLLAREARDEVLLAGEHLGEVGELALGELTQLVEALQSEIAPRSEERRVGKGSGPGWR